MDFVKKALLLFFKVFKGFVPLEFISLITGEGPHFTFIVVSKFTHNYYGFTFSDIVELEASGCCSVDSFVKHNTYHN